MVLPFGKGHRRRRRGYALRVCPICRSVRVFAAIDFEQYTHVYFLTVSEERAVHTTMTCEDCGVCMDMPTDRGVSIHHSSDLDTLWELLTPESQRHLAEEANAQLDLLRNGEAWDAERRQGALAAPFRACESEFASKIRGDKVHASSWRRVAAGCAGILLFGVAAIFYWSRGSGVELALFAGLGTLFVFLHEYSFFEESSRRHLRRRIFPRLLRGLSPLRPTLEELRRVQKTLNSEGLYIAREEVFRQFESEWERVSAMKSRLSLDVPINR